MSQVQINPPFDIRADFWKNNWPIRFVEPYDELYDTYGKEISSTLMWCMWLAEDPSRYNPLRELPSDQLIDAIQKYYEGFDPDDELIDKCRKSWDTCFLSQAAVSFKNERSSFVARSQMIADATNELRQRAKANPLILSQKDYRDLMSQLDRMRANTDKLATVYSSAASKFQIEENEVRIHGGGRESLIESGGLVELNDEDE